jgi:hemolysin III
MTIQAGIPREKKGSKSPSPREETFSSLTHGLGAGLSLSGSILLVYRAVAFGDLTHIISFSVYGASMILLYTASSLYHGFRQPRLKRVFKVIDHASIFLLIAGTYTPFLLVGIKGSLAWTFLIVIWGLALLGVTFKAFFIQRLQRISVLFYVLMGWLSVVVIKAMLEKFPPGVLIWLATGGVTYTVGVIFYTLKRVPYMHVVWHFFVLGGSLCHYMAVLLYLAPAN